MSKEFDKEYDGDDSGLKVMGDASVHPIRKSEPKASGETPAGGKKGQETAAPEGADDGNRKAESHRKGAASAAKKTAADSAKKTGGHSGSGLTLRQERELSKKRKRRRLIALFVAECFALAAIFGYASFLRRWNQIQRPQFNEVEIKNNDISQDTVEQMKGYWTIAIFGVDARDKSLTKSTNADVNLICNINLDTGEIKLVSVYRDSYLNISKNGSYNKINQAYFIGGPEQAVSALNRNLDLNITDYMTFNWKAVADAINVLGGVDVEISKAEFYYINSFITETVKVTGVGSHQLTSAGMNHLDGVQAVAYGRLRLMDTDYARTERQRKIIKLAFEKAKKADFDTLNRVLGTVFPQVATSINVNDIFNSLKIINRYHIGETTGFPQARGDANMGKKGACVIPQTLESNVVKLHEFLFGEENYTPSATVKSISAKIAADSGMYKEGKYVDSVGTDGGVIQSAKAAKSAEAASAAASDANSDTKYAVVYVLDEDGNKVKKSVAMETNADGEYIEPETNANGIAKGWSLNKDGKLVSRETDADGNMVETSPSDKNKPTMAETDENGNPIESSSLAGPGETGESVTGTSGSTKPTAPETDANGKLVTKESSAAALRPGFLDETSQAGTGAGNSSNNTAPTAPSASTGASTNPTNAANSTNPTSANTSTGSLNPTNASNTSSGTGAPGSNISSAPGSTSSGSPTGTTAANSSNSGSSSGVSSGPGSSNQTVIDSSGPSSGTVSAPGQ
jgi:LCP family protein required for cell wall assembly